MTEDAPDDPNARGDTAARGVSECLYPGLSWDEIGRLTASGAVL